MFSCDIQGCKEPALAIMKWPKGNPKLPLYLCDDHEKYYKSIAGKHMRFEQIDDKSEPRT